MEVINTGIAESGRKIVIEGLTKLLADTYVLYFKTHHFHWNLRGPFFHSWHALLNEQYKELIEAVDALAERIRALGSAVPGGYSAHAKIATIKEEPGCPAAMEMLRQLLADHETITRNARTLLEAWDKTGDAVSVDLVTQRMAHHEQTAWMLRSSLAE